MERSIISLGCFVMVLFFFFFFFLKEEEGIGDLTVTGVQTCALPIWRTRRGGNPWQMVPGQGGQTDVRPPRQGPDLSPDCRLCGRCRAKPATRMDPGAYRDVFNDCLSLWPTPAKFS